MSEVADNGYRITALDGNIHIAGTAQHDLQAGAYRFLEEYCNRKIYTQDIIVCPKNDRITVPADADVIYEPFFEYTDTNWNSPRNAEYSMANGLNGGQYRTLGPEMGDTVNYIGGFCHTMGWLCETWKYAETHPEYLALHDGVRTTDQPCLTNPEVLRICTENVLNLLAEKHDPSAPLQIVSVTQNDNYSCCECETCVAFENEHGGQHSATVLNFVNQVADAVKAAGYGNVAIDTFAYTYSQAAPENIVPRDNVIVRLCSIFCCFAHPFDVKCNREFMQDLADWSEICDRLYVWDYATNYSHTVAVFPNFSVIQKNMQILYEHNVRGVYVEGNYYVDRCDAEFSELRAYMISKCLQDPYCDLDKEVDGFPWMEFSRLGKLTSYYKNSPWDESIMNVSVAQHCDTCCFSSSAWYGSNDHGRSWHNGAKDTSENAVLYGYNFDEQWDFAEKLDPDIVFVTGFNEWVAQRLTFRENEPFGFCDNCDEEYSRDFEPSAGVLGDNYYMQFVDRVAGFKGSTAALPAAEEVTIDIGGGFDQWDDEAITGVYRDYTNDTVDRDCRGYGDTYYQDTSGRNDIANAKVAHDGEKLYFYVDTAEELTPCTDDNWMQLFLNVSGEREGYEFIVNRTSPENGKAAVERVTENGCEAVGQAEIRFEGDRLMLSVERSLLGVEAEGSFCFKWADNCDPADIYSFYTRGDSAPYGRLNWVYSTAAPQPDDRSSKGC